MDATKLIQQFSNLNVWKSGDERAPHKPLLDLYALGRYSRGAPKMIPYKELETTLHDLIRDFGRIRKQYHPEQPFWHMQNDDVWELSTNELDVQISKLTRPNRRLFIGADVSGGFPEFMYESLIKDKSLCPQIAAAILSAHFPPSIHEDIADAVGLDLFAPGIRVRRDPQFREKVLQAYEYRCAVCEFTARLAHVLVGLEAAHIKRRQAGGPDKEINGLALCSLHHKLFDRGVFTLTGSLIITVSEKANGEDEFRQAVLDFNGISINTPQRPEYYPADEYLDWHYREVFQAPGRLVSGTNR